MTVETQEKTYFDRILEGEFLSAEMDFRPEDFVPCKSTILAVMCPPKKKTEGGLHLPESVLEQSNIGRVAAVPDDPKCPVQLGDWIVLRYSEGYVVKFGNRTDLRLLQYSEDTDTEILGYFRFDSEPVEA